VNAFDIALLLGAGLLGGASNALAGGGTFFTFPAMIEVGLSPVVANASNAVALWPGRFPSVMAGWRDLAKLRGRLPLSCAIAAIGSLFGAWLLLSTQERVFTAMIPWLLLFATLLFAFGAKLIPLFRAMKPKRGGGGVAFVAGAVFETIVAIYGGYFGAGAAFMVMAGNAMTGVDDVHQNVALKNLLITLMTTVSVAVFVAAGAVAWRETLIMMLGAFPGGYIGAKLARRLHPVRLRVAIIVIGLAMSAYYFAKVYL
jgi:uncharacterized membrane protein YfcA